MTKPKYPDPATTAQYVPVKFFRRRWSCWVYDSGLHNGCRCNESDPHSEECHWHYRADITEEQWRRLGLEAVS